MLLTSYNLLLWFLFLSYFYYAINLIKLIKQYNWLVGEKINQL